MNEILEETQECSTGCGQVAERPVSSREVRPLWKLEDTGDLATLRVALPGVHRDEVEISARENVVSLNAPRTGDPAPKDAVRLAYALELRLSRELDSQATSAKLRDGVLTLTFPRKEEAKPRTITVSG